MSHGGAGGDVLRERTIQQLRPGEGGVWVVGRRGDGQDRHGRTRFALCDADGSVEVVAQAEMACAVPAGSWVRLRGAVSFDGLRFHADRLEVVGPPLLRPGEAPTWDEGLSRGRLQRRLQQRGRLLEELRAVLRERDYLEVETPTLLEAPGQEPHLLPFVTRLSGHGGDRARYLATSPEYAMKRLLVHGCERIYQLGRSFRNGPDEVSALHQPEFTLLEWYRAFAGLADLGADVECMLSRVARAVTGGTVIGRHGRFVDCAAPLRWVTVEQAFAAWAGLDLAPYLDGDDEGFLRAVPLELICGEGSSAQRAEATFFRVLVEKVEPNLGISRPVLLHRYPARHAALARLADDDSRVAERFELYLLGVELANAFDELRDPLEQERRLRREQQERLAAGGPRLPVCEQFLRALRSGLPPAAGIALGVDRLLLVLVGAASLEEVVAFPEGRPPSPPSDS